MKKISKGKGLSISETQRLLGAEAPVPTGKLPTDPIGMKAIPAIVRERLISRGGRPSDPAWTIVRKIPMRAETWAQLDRLSQEFQKEDVRVSAGQIAAFALERGLALDSSSSNEAAMKSDRISSQALSKEAREKGCRMHAELQRDGFWSCA